MRILILHLFNIFLFFGAVLCNGQTIDTISKMRKLINQRDVKFIIKTNILPPIISAFKKQLTYTYSFEICINKRLSVQTTGLFTSYHKQQRHESSDEIIADLKYFFDENKAYSGIYMGTYWKAINYHYSNKEFYPQYITYLNFEQQSIGGGLILGYQNNIKKHIVFDLLIGFGGRHITNTNIIDAVNINLSNQKQTVFDSRFGLFIGYKF